MVLAILVSTLWIQAKLFRGVLGCRYTCTRYTRTIDQSFHNRIYWHSKEGKTQYRCQSNAHKAATNILFYSSPLMLCTPYHTRNAMMLPLLKRSMQELSQGWKMSPLGNTCTPKSNIDILYQIYRKCIMHSRRAYGAKIIACLYCITIFVFAFWHASPSIFLHSNKLCQCTCTPVGTTKEEATTSSKGKEGKKRRNRTYFLWGPYETFENTKNTNSIFPSRFLYQSFETSQIWRY